MTATVTAAVSGDRMSVVVIGIRDVRFEALCGEHDHLLEEWLGLWSGQPAARRGAWSHPAWMPTWLDTYGRARGVGNPANPHPPPLPWVPVYETATAGCHYDGRHYRIWKERTFDSALRLRRAPADDPRHRLHGHSYRIRLHLTAPLDEVRGWTVDYGEVKARFEPIYRALDHHRLDELPGLDDADPAGLLRWIKAALADCGLPLDRIDLEQTPGCGALLCWGEEGPALPV